jgi:hypothetical protein
MKVFGLGGYGKVGLPAIKLLAQSDLVTRIAVVGRSLERAEKVAREIGEKGVGVQAEGTDEEKLTALVAGYDMVMNAAYDATVLPALRAAVRAGAHYCDANSVIDPALGLGPEAAAAGVIATVANGIHPGISNLMGVHVARQLEEVEQLQIGFASIFNWETGRELTPRQWLGDPEENLTALHEFRPFIAWMLGMVRDQGIRTALDYQDGGWVEVDPVGSGFDVPMTRGGTTTAYPYFSGNPLYDSLPRDLARIPPVEMIFSPLPPQLHDLLREGALRVLDGRIDPDTAVDSFYDAVEGDPHRWLRLPADLVTIPEIWTRAVGRKEGRAARHTCWFTEPMWEVGGYFLTGVALAAAARMTLRGEVQARGVLHAEKAFEPLPILDEVASLIPDYLPDGKLIDESFEWLA